MSASVALQAAIYERLTADPRVSAIVADRVFDGAPTGAAFPYIEFGPSDAVPADAECVPGRIETLQIDCWSRKDGRLSGARALADAVKAALHHAELDLGDHALLSLRVAQSRTFMDQDGLTAHGVVTVEGVIEEAA